MRSALIVLLVMLSANLVIIYFAYNLIPATFYSTEPDSEYSFIIDEGDELEAQWKYMALNQSILEKLVNETNINIDLTSYNQEDITEWDLSILEGKSSSYYWKVLRDEFNWRGDYKQYVSSHKYRIYKKPELHLCNMFRNDNYYTNRLIPIEVDDFIKSMNYYIYGNEAWLVKLVKNYTLETNSINTITILLRNNSKYREILTYNEDGILYDHTIYYDNHTAMNFKLIKYEIHGSESPVYTTNRWFLVIRLLNILSVATIIEVIIVIVLISSVHDSRDKKPQKKVTLEQKNINKGHFNQLNDSSGNNARKSILKYQSCLNCSVHLEENSRFCYNCGKPTKSQGNVCQYCGKLRLKDAKYCIECGHIF